MGDQYRDAINLIEQEDTLSALTLLQSLREEEPDYRDVQERIAQILQTHRVHEIFAEAEQAYQQGQWSEAILLYNLIRQQDITYQLSTVELHLFDSYMQLAGQKMTLGGLSAAGVVETADLYRNALSIRPRDGLAQANLSLLSQYQQAGELMAQKQYGQSTSLLAALYANNPDFLGGDAKRRLFDSRMGYAGQLEEEGNLFAALVQYNAAAVLPVEGALQAQLRAQSVERALMPTATSTPTPTATPTPDPFEAILKMITPTPAPLEQYTGWIAFRSDRPGSRTGLWVMRPDGSEVLPANDPTGLYDHLIEQATWSPDNQRRIWVEDDGSGVSVAIYMWRYDVPAHWKEARVELLNNSGINYQPSFSPDTQSIVFTSQRHAGPTDGDWGLWGDEIFIIYFADYNPSGYVQPRRLTNNDWEWDKHPTFSPDGQTIAFWSNRISGRAQIWAMNVDGSNQRNLSNNEWNDWDPVWLVPKRELPELEGDENTIPVFDPALYDLDN
jgi:TolB protein